MGRGPGALPRPVVWAVRPASSPAARRFVPHRGAGGGDSRHRGEGLLSLIHPTRHTPSVAHTPGRGRTPRSCLGTSSLDEATGTHTHTHKHGPWPSHQIHTPGHLYTHPGHPVGLRSHSTHPGSSQQYSNRHPAALLWPACAYAPSTPYTLE